MAVGLFFFLADAAQLAPTGWFLGLKPKGAGGGLQGACSGRGGGLNVALAASCAGLAALRSAAPFSSPCQSTVIAVEGAAATTGAAGVSGASGGANRLTAATEAGADTGAGTASAGSHTVMGKVRASAAGLRSCGVRTDHSASANSACTSSTAKAPAPRRARCRAVTVFGMPVPGAW